MLDWRRIWKDRVSPISLRSAPIMGRVVALGPKCETKDNQSQGHVTQTYLMTRTLVALFDGARA